MVQIHNTKYFLYLLTSMLSQRFSKWDTGLHRGAPMSRRKSHRIAEPVGDFPTSPESEI